MYKRQVREESQGAVAMPGSRSDYRPPARVVWFEFTGGRFIGVSGVVEGVVGKRRYGHDLHVRDLPNLSSVGVFRLRPIPSYGQTRDCLLYTSRCV